MTKYERASKPKILHEKNAWISKAVCCLGLYLLGYFHLHTFLVVIACAYVFLSLAIDTETARKIQLVLWPYKVPLPTSAEDWIQMAASGPEAGRKPGMVINSFFLFSVSFL